MIEAGVEVEATAAPRSLPAAAAAAAAAAVSEATKIRRDWAVFNSGVFSWNRAPGGRGNGKRLPGIPTHLHAPRLHIGAPGGKCVECSLINILRAGGN